MYNAFLCIYTYYRLIFFLLFYTCIGLYVYESHYRKQTFHCAVAKPFGVTLQVREFDCLPCSRVYIYLPR